MRSLQTQRDCVRRGAMLGVLAIVIGCAEPAADQPDGASAAVVTSRGEGHFTIGEAAMNELTVSAGSAKWRQWLDGEGVVSCVASLPPQESTDKAYRNLVWSCPRSLTPSSRNALEYSSASDTWVLTDGEGRISLRFSFRRAPSEHSDAASAAAMREGATGPLQAGADSLPANAYGRFRSNAELLVIDLGGLRTIQEEPQIDPLFVRHLGPPKDIGETLCRLDGSVRRRTPDDVSNSTLVLNGWKRCRYADGDTAEWSVEPQYVPSNDAWVIFFDSRPTEKWVYRRTGPSPVADAGANLIDLPETSTVSTFRPESDCTPKITASLDSILTAKLCHDGYGVTPGGDTVRKAGGWVVSDAQDRSEFLMTDYQTRDGRFLATQAVTGTHSDGSLRTAVLQHTKMPDRGELTGDWAICTRQGQRDRRMVVRMGGVNATGGQIINAAWVIEKQSGVLRSISTDGVVCESYHG